MKPVQVEESKEEAPNPSNDQHHFETTAAFATYKEQTNKNAEQVNEKEEYAQNPFSSAIVNETNKIKNMIEQVDNKQELQNQINKKMDLKSNLAATTDESPISRGPIVGNTKIGELSEIVQQLLEDQRNLKSKLNERDEIIADLSKNRENQRKNTQDKERRSRSQKPVNSKKIGSADNTTNAARKLREKHTKEKERISAIESKIVKARQRKAEFNKGTAVKANKVGGFGNQYHKNRPNSDFDPKLYKKKNSDLDGIKDKNR